MRRRHRARQQSYEQRDQAWSGFTAVLERLLDATPFARGAALVDTEGEAVDYAGDLDAFDLKVAAAHLQIVFSELSSSPKLPRPRQVIVRARARSFLIREIQPGYCLALVLYRHAAFAVSERALSEAAALLSSEAGWDCPPDAARWHRVDVEPEPGDRSRPRSVRLLSGARSADERVFRPRHDEGWLPVEVMGYLVGLRRPERGYRVRLATGVEMTLVYERRGCWFADEALELP